MSLTEGNWTLLPEHLMTAVDDSNHVSFHYLFVSPLRSFDLWSVIGFPGWLLPFLQRLPQSPSHSRLSYRLQVPLRSAVKTTVQYPSSPLIPGDGALGVLDMSGPFLLINDIIALYVPGYMERGWSGHHQFSPLCRADHKGRRGWLICLLRGMRRQLRSHRSGSDFVFKMWSRENSIFEFSLGTF